MTSSRAWWRSVGPGLITACVVFGPGSLLLSSNVGAVHGYDLLWLVVLNGILMGTYLTLGARIGVIGQATPCTLIAERVGRPAAALIGVTLFLVCSSFQFSNNVAFALAARSLIPAIGRSLALQVGVLLLLNGAIVLFLFKARHVYRILERLMKVMVGVILACFLFNLLLAFIERSPAALDVVKGLVPGLPEGLSLGLPRRVDGAISDPMLLVAGLVGTTFSVGGAFYQGNLVREKGWKVEDYRHGFRDAIAGVCVLAGVSLILMITTATVIPGQEADDIGVLANSLQPFLGNLAYVAFCIGLIAVASNPFLINAMIGGSILADGLGKAPRLSDPWPRRLTVLVLAIGMAVASLALYTGEKPVSLIVFGQALTILGNPLMAASMLWLANRRDVMGEHRNGVLQNVLGVIGLVAVLLLACRVLWTVVLRLSG